MTQLRHRTRARQQQVCLGTESNTQGKMAEPALALLWSGPENHGQAEYADKHHVTSKMEKKKKKAGSQAGPDPYGMRLPHSLCRPHPVGEQAVWCPALC